MQKVASQLNHTALIAGLKKKETGPRGGGRYNRTAGSGEKSRGYWVKGIDYAVGPDGFVLLRPNREETSDFSRLPTDVLRRRLAIL
ncbi:hypothetical protein MACH01_08830 [Thalassospira tepidiphila]|nr:hypothetical protein MACH01_08830 [Thalassospira tepidiphila]